MGEGEGNCQNVLHFGDIIRTHTRTYTWPPSCQFFPHEEKNMHQPNEKRRFTCLASCYVTLLLLLLLHLATTFFKTRFPKIKIFHILLSPFRLCGFSPKTGAALKFAAAATLVSGILHMFRIVSGRATLYGRGCRNDCSTL